MTFERPARKIAVMLATEVPPKNFQRLSDVYTLHPAYTDESRLAVARAHGDTIRAVITRGALRIDAPLIAALPKLQIICSSGVGYEGIDLCAAQARGIVVTHGRGVNADTVADQCFALLLAVIRQVPAQDLRARQGLGRHLGQLLPQVTGRRLGIFGFGDIGQRIARRASGFDMPVRYFSRRPVPGSLFPRAESLIELAAGSDILVVAAPGGASTRHMVNAAVLDALGPQGWLVNIGRGSVVETTALIAALQAQRIAGAGLDVVENEPDLPPELCALNNVVLSPHIGGLSPEASANSLELMLNNLSRFFAGEPVLTAVPA